MTKEWSRDEEAQNLGKRFEAVNQAAFARTHKVPGGASMITQHIKGHRPINMDQALAYAAGFGVELAEISPRLAARVVAAKGLGLDRPISHVDLPENQRVKLETPLAEIPSFSKRQSADAEPESTPEQVLAKLDELLLTIPPQNRTLVAHALAEWAHHPGQAQWAAVILNLQTVKANTG